MEDMLTEIRSYSLFHEYLNVVGVATPSPARFVQDWEYKDADRLLARIKTDPQGHTRYYIDARAISVN
ncbi:hypothetical protein [Aeromonas molluscorum]|jgi:hypothetical protein|uniref:Uncharacterized protein n=1 Tax=Aeromonas molluscorum 848 TaxID=1268236 RepID=R1F4G8_9GAMM|nr:hypothetical protein [Aeromonas molluscorum]EOD54783.1 hypothetical protein G113_12509 [Aeromonas molluscorum 848]